MRPCLLILLLAFSGAGLSQSPLSSTLQRKGPFWDERSATLTLPIMEGLPVILPQWAPSMVSPSRG